MWWNYRKPKPLKKGAYRFAVKSNVPIVPCFITMQDSNIVDDDGFKVQEYTIHIEDNIWNNDIYRNKFITVEISNTKLNIIEKNNRTKIKQR